MAALLVRSALFLGASAFAWAEAEAHWDDAVNLIQQDRLGRRSVHEEEDSEEDEVAAPRRTQEDLLAAGSTGKFCLTDHKGGAAIGCMGGRDCVRCVNGYYACTEGYHPVIDYFDNVHCATSSLKAKCLQNGCKAGGCCEQTCCAPQLTAEGQRRKMMSVFYSAPAEEEEVVQFSSATPTKPSAVRSRTATSPSATHSTHSHAPTSAHSTVAAKTSAATHSHTPTSAHSKVATKTSLSHSQKPTLAHSAVAAKTSATHSHKTTSAATKTSATHSQKPTSAHSKVTKKTSVTH